jgi:hypothetical protein
VVFGGGASWAVARWELFGLMGVVVSTQWLQLVWLAFVIHRRHGVTFVRQIGSAATWSLAMVAGLSCLLAWFSAQLLTGLVFCVASAMVLGILSFLMCAWCLRKDLPNPRALLLRKATGDRDAVNSSEAAVKVRLRRAA